MEGIREVLSVPLVVMANNSLGSGFSRSEMVRPKSDTSRLLLVSESFVGETTCGGREVVNPLVLEIKVESVMAKVTLCDGMIRDMV